MSVRLHRALIFAVVLTQAIAGRAQVVTTQLVPTKTFKVPWASAMEILPFKCDSDGNIYGRFGLIRMRYSGHRQTEPAESYSVSTPSAH